MTTGDQIIARLRNVREEGDGQYRSYSPLRSDSNSQSFWLKVNPDGEHGTFRDHAADNSLMATGSLYTLAEFLGIEVPTSTPRLKSNSTKHEYGGLAEYAEAHYVTERVFVDAGWYQTEHLGRPALAYPTANGERYRLIDGAKPTYINNRGYKACLYGATRAVAMASELGSAIVICNGEASTVVAQSMGIPAVCHTGGEKKWDQSNVDALNALWQGRLIIAMDCDETGIAAGSALAEQFGDRAAVVDLGFDEHGDLADFCNVFGSDGIGELMRRSAVADKVESQLTDAELIAKATQEVANALRKRDEKGVTLETAVAKARSVLDRVTMNLARPVVVSFRDLSWRAELESMERRNQNSDVIGLSLNFQTETKIVRGFPSVDIALGGVPEDLMIIMGATGASKTWTAISFARELLLQAPGLIVTTEMPTRKWMQRLAASMARADYGRLKHGRSEPDEWRRLSLAYDMLANMGADVLDHPSPTSDLIGAAFASGREAGRGYKWLMVDSVSKMNHAGQGEIYGIMRGAMNGLQDISRVHEVPVIATLQTGSDLEAPSRRGARMPQLKDAYGGMTAVQNAGVVFGLYNHAYYVRRGLEDENYDYPRGVVALRGLKIRDEDDGDAPVIRMKWMGAGHEELQTVSLRRED